MTTYNDTNIEQPITFNKLTNTQFNNAAIIETDELYLVDPEFVGKKCDGHKRKVKRRR